MSDSANVTSITAIHEFEGFLKRFGEEGLGALLAIDQELNRSLGWIENDRPTYWKQQVRIGFDEMAKARVRLEQCKMRTVAGNRPACIEEEQDLAAAKRKLETAQQKVEAVRRWAHALRREVEDYRARVSNLRRRLETEVPRMVALLDRTLDALEKYADSVGAPLEVEPTPASTPMPTDSGETA